MGGARRRRLRRDDRPAARLRQALSERVPFSTLDGRARGPRADGTVKALFRTARRPAGRGGADALPRRPALDLPLLAVGLPAHLHVLRHRPDAVRPQPDRVGDPRPGAALPPARRGRPRRVHGHGRADDEPRQRARRVRSACPTSASPTAARRSRRSAGSRGSSGWRRSRCRSAWRCRCTPPTTRCAPS